MLDSIESHFGHDPKLAGRAIRLWLEYEQIGSSEALWGDVDLFLSGLEDGDRDLLEEVIKLNNIQVNYQQLLKENQQLKLAVANMATSNASGTGNFVSVSPSLSDDISLNDAFSGFVVAKKNNQSKPATIFAYENDVGGVVRILIAITRSDNLMVSEIEAKHIRQYVALLSVMPASPKANGVTDKMGTSEIIRLVKDKCQDELSVLGLKPLGQRAIGNKFTNVKGFIKFIESQQYPIKAGFDSMIQFTGKGNKSSKESRRPFEKNELKLLFESERYRLCKFKRPCDYWAPLLALFTGARQGELVQLYVSDVSQIDGVWVIDINDKADKQLKNQGSCRIVPVHSQLIKLGFDGFVEKCRSAGQVKLFPEEVRNKRGQFSYSKRFQTLRKNCRIGVAADDTVDFHSFRHLVSTELIGNEVLEGVVNDIVGHGSQQRSETKRAYAAKGSFLSVKVEAIKKLKYDINFNYTKFWR
ncbi:MAG: site-specific integrase [Colwellia sp.]